MMHWMRHAGKTWIAKGLFIILVGSFAIWGIGPIFNSGRVQTAATAGNEKIPTSAVEDALRQQMQAIQKQYGFNMSAEQAAQLGLKRQVAQQLVMQSLYSQEAQHLGVLFNRDTLKQTIAMQPALRGEDGKFDIRRFTALLQGLGMNENTYLQALRGDLTRTILLGGIQTAAATPDILVKPLYSWNNEKRVGLVREIKASDITGIADPSADELKKFYDDKAQSFMAPEYRSVSYVVLDLEKISATINPSEDDIKAAYDASPQDFGSPEKRTIAQITTQDQALAEKIASEAAGRPLKDVAKENAANYSEIELMPGSTFPEISKVVFGLETGKTSAAVKSPMGWHVITLLKITPGETPPLAKVHDQIAAKLRRQQAEDKMYDLSKQLQDSTAGGSTLAEAAKQLGLELITLGDVTSDGKGVDGKPVAEHPLQQQAIQMAYTVGEGETSPVQETDQGLYMVNVDKVTAAQVKPLESIKAEVVAAWRSTKQLEMAEAKAQEMADRLNKGEDVSGLTRTDALVRNPARGTSTLPAGVVAGLFATQPGKATTYNTETSAWVIKLAEVQKPSLENAKLDDIRTELKQQIGNDLLEQYGAALRTHYGATLNESWLAQTSKVD